MVKKIIFLLLVAIPASTLFFYNPHLLSGGQKEHDASHHASHGDSKEKYKVLGDLEKAGKIRPVEVVKYFNYSCGHCYKFFQGEDVLHKRFEGKAKFIKIPIFWGKQTPYPAMAYYYALKHGKGSEVNQAIFDAHFQYDLDVFDLSVLNQILLEHGLPLTINERSWDHSPDLKKQVQKGLELADRFDIHETPSIVINEAVKIAPEHTKGEMPEMLRRVRETILELFS